VLPYNSFALLGSGLFVCSPEFCFQQLARKLTLIETIQLGFELCGSYCLPAITHHAGLKTPASNCQYSLPELTNVRKLSVFIGCVKSEKGSGQAFNALKYVTNNSGSPMETILVMLLTLPYRLGGYGLPMPELNYQINPVGVTKRRTNTSHYRCDLLWPSVKLAVEYDSEQYHCGAEKIFDDSKHRNLLSSMGYPPIIVTKQQLYDVEEFEKVVRLLAQKLGKQLKHRSSNFQVAHRRLRKELLGQ
jgi:very-short-patch-repair endonuclease